VFISARETTQPVGYARREFDGTAKTRNGIGYRAEMNLCDTKLPPHQVVVRIDLERRSCAVGGLIVPTSNVQREREPKWSNIDSGSVSSAVRFCETAPSPRFCGPRYHRT
jgi:hypothetical protein